ncbi:MAG: hypothetical protein COV29_01785 [Candidatus Yanofskybacteria bacterium CG10_big_fil_rev_8_21_14_0_10_36_16]|uniref:Uncharacterized protein n=1 Tax=Candidatus Yanofskybacteria bacterium CG10_big_fil_rev_8_21_14_0_10_36_16 TaxID=1975096 RepID=A0A2J0Q7D8_9BACT|nr:MAG: hypothetical protein COV29_01785 [Candidatus Yanofskybacteria bacterium CG10_big_fil_rev_8_21_14_0_10_36_16]
MNKILSTTLLISLAFLSFFPLSLVAESFVFTDTFDSTRNINPDVTTAEIRSGRIFIADESSASRVESRNVRRTSYDITNISMSAAHSLPGGSRIVYFASNDGGDSWIQLIPGYLSQFQTSGRELRWAAVLTRPSNDSQSPFIESITLNFREGGDRLKDKNDSRRISDLNKVASALRYYFNDKGNYPIVNGVNPDIRWRELGNVLTRKNSSGRQYISKMPASIPAIDGSIIDYDYKSVTGALENIRGFGYILAVQLENPDRRDLERDTDGVWGPINCNDPVYCKVLGVEQSVSASAIKGSLTVDIPLGSLVRVQNDYKVYYVTEKGLKRHVPNEQVFLSYGNEWGDVLVVPPGATGSVYSFPDNKFIYLEGIWPRKIYFLDGGIKYFVSDQLLSQIGLAEKQIAPVNWTEINSYPTGATNENWIRDFANSL